MTKANNRKPFLHGDTLVEVLFAVAIFGMVSVSAIAMMNKGVATAQGTLETSMARQEIDTQAEALRFIHNAYSMNASDSDNPYVKLWKKLTDPSIVLKSNQTADFLASSNYNGQSCNAIYSNAAVVIPDKSFVINPRLLNNTDLSSSTYNNFPTNATTLAKIRPIHKTSGSPLIATPTYPRLVYSTTPDSLSDYNNLTDLSLSSAEGIWVTVVQEGTTNKPQYYDFYIRTCWSNISGNGSTTISTIVRLYNPDATTL